MRRSSQGATPFLTRPSPRRGAALAVLAAAALGTGCTSRPGGGPVPTAVLPGAGSTAVPVAVRIRGEEFNVRVTSDFANPEVSRIDAGYQARLGDVALQDVTLRADGDLAATVPAGLASGLHDLTVVDPWGRSGRLPGAYLVLAGAAGARIASYRIDPLGEQEAFRPFTATIEALDATGAVVTDFNGTVRLSDLTGTGVPAAAARFAAGRWTGLVEVRAPHAADVLTVADDQGASGTSAAFAVRAPRVAAARFATAPPETEAGRCSGPLTVLLQDAFGLPVQAAGDTALTVTATPPTGFKLYGDASCATQIDSPLVSAGKSSVSVWFSATLAGVIDVAVAAPGLTSSVQRATVVAGPPAAISFVTNPQVVNAGACSQPATIEVRDAFGNPSPPANLTLTLAATPPAGVSFSTSASCAGAAPSLALGGGATRADFHFSGTTAEVVKLTVAAPGLSAATQDQVVTPEGKASRLAFLTAPRGAAAGACSEQLSLQAQDSYGNPVASAGAVQVSLAASPAAGFDTYADPACTTPAATLQIGAGQSTTGFHFRGTLPASVAVTASSPSLTGTSQTESVGPAASSQVVFATGAQTVRAGTCSAAVLLQAQDRYGNASPVGAPLAVGLSAVPAAGFGFFSDPACASPIAGVTLAAGASEASFYFEGAQAGAVAVTAAPNGVTGGAQTEQLRPAAASRLVFTSAPQTVAAGACSGAAAVEIRDAHGNLAPLPGSALISLDAAPAAGFTFYRDAACSVPASTLAVPAGGSGATFRFSATTPGPVTVTASAAGLDPDTQTETVKAALPAQLTFATAAQTIAADTCSATVTLETRNASGTATPVSEAAAITLTASPAAGVAFFAGAGCSGSAISTLSLAAGGSSITFSLRSTATGPVTITAASQLLGSAAQIETVNPLSPDRVVFETTPQTVAIGACSAATTLRTQDRLGNTSAVAAATLVALTAAPGSGFTFHTDAACTSPVSAVTVPAGGSAASLYFKGTVAGSVELTATPSGLTAASQTARIVAGGPDHLAFTSAAQTVGAGACSSAVGVQALDSAGNAALVSAATAVTLSASPATGVSFFAGAGCSGAQVTSVSIAAGAGATTFSFLATTSGSVTITAAIAGLASSPTQVETITPGALHHFTWDPIPSPQAVAIAFPVTVTARDAWENVAVSFVGTAALSASAGAATCESSCSSAGVTGGFLVGVWTGSVSVSPPGSELTLRSTSGTATATSSAFDVSPPASRSPPIARLSVSPTVVISGGGITLDAGGSSDHQTATAQLSVSWDFEGQSASAQSAPVPPAAPWTTWSTTKTATHLFINNGANGAAPVVFRPRVAVKDVEAGPGGPDVAYASATVVVLPNGNNHCMVDTPSDVDDGATSCYARGTDGKLSLREALRLANASSSPIAIDFSGPMTIAGSGTLSVSRPVYLVARPGVALDTATLSISSPGVLIAGLELSRQASPVVVETGGDATFRDVYLHDGAGFVVKGRAHLDRLRASGCRGTCVEVNDAGAYLALFDSDLRGSRTNTGLALTSCAAVAWSPGTLAGADQPYNGSILVASTVFSQFGTAVSSSCASAVLTNDTFFRNATAVTGVGASLLDSIFSGQTVEAIACPGFTSSLRHVLWQNTSNGCQPSDFLAVPMATFSFAADPLFVYPASGDFRVQYGSQARDWGMSTNVIDLDGPGPGRFLGSNADRGGRETY